MLDRNVGDALLKLDLTPQSEPPAAQIERIIDADRRRVRRWTRIAIALWILAALGALGIFVMGGFAFPMIARMVQKAEVEAIQDADAPTMANPNTPFLVLAKLTAMCLVFGTGSFLVLVCAGLATVLLLVRSRSATLRQINANLLQISEQLKRLPPGGTAPTVVPAS
jgi:hypothetical protein